MLRENPQPRRSRKIALRSKRKGTSTPSWLSVRWTKLVGGLRKSHRARSPVLLLSILLIFNLACITADVWHRRRSMDKTPAAAQDHVTSHPLQLNDGRSDERWNSLLNQPLLGFYFMIGLVPFALIVGTFCKRPNQLRSTKMAHGLVLILASTLLVSLRGAFDFAAIQVLTDQGYVQFHAVHETMIGNLVLIPAAVGVSLLASGMLKGSPSRSQRACL
jgi:thiosulfate reductase cytochrome b subunit